MPLTTRKFNEANQKDSVVVEDGVKECVSQKPSTLQTEMKESSLPNLSPGEGSEAGVSLRRLRAITGNWKFSDTFKKKKEKAREGNLPLPLLSGPQSVS